MGTGNTIPPAFGSLLKRFVLRSTDVPFAGYWAGFGVEAAVNTFAARQDCSQGCLYDIVNDPNEQHDLAATHPDLVKQMNATLNQMNQGIFRPDRGNESVLACKVGGKQYGGFYGPFVDLH